MSAVGLRRLEGGWGGRGPLRWPTAAALLALGLAAGFGLGRQSAAPPAESSPEVAFVRGMAVHGEQAVAVALAVRDRTPDPAVRTLAQEIALAQQGQVGRMHGWLLAWGRPLREQPPTAGHASMAPSAVTQPQMMDLLTSLLPTARRPFLELTINHRRTGVGLSESALRRVRRPDVRGLVESTIASQRDEIAYLERLLEERGAPPTASTGSGPERPGRSGVER